MDLINLSDLIDIAEENKYTVEYIEKDYFLTVLLYFLKDIDGLYFKGGTALNKIFLNQKRLSEDLDFTTKLEISELKKIIGKIVAENKPFFIKEEYDKQLNDFIRIKIYYKSFFSTSSYIWLDFNRRPTLLLEPEKYVLPNFYSLDFQITTLNKKELFAEKLCATITRNQPRDYFDLYFILKNDSIDLKLTEKKLLSADKKLDFNMIFKNANKIYSRWKDDISKLTNYNLGYIECIKFLDFKLRK